MVSARERALLGDAWGHVLRHGHLSLSLSLSLLCSAYGKLHASGQRRVVHIGETCLAASGSASVPEPAKKTPPPPPPPPYAPISRTLQAPSPRLELVLLLSLSAPFTSCRCQSRHETQLPEQGDSENNDALASCVTRKLLVGLSDEEAVEGSAVGESCPGHRVPRRLSIKKHLTSSLTSCCR